MKDVQHQLSHVRLVSTLLMVALCSAICLSAWASSTSATGLPSAELSKYKETLRRTGASRTELEAFEERISKTPTSVAVGLMSYLQSNPSSYLRMFRRGLEEERAPGPPAIFPGAAPVLSCKELRGISARETTIDSAEVADDGGSCRVIATVIHPPARNPIRVFVALPIKAWNGRFMGTGGGGYSGGSANNLDGYASKGYAVGATDTGNPEGTANFALDAQGKADWQRMRDNGYLGIHDMTVVGKALTQAFYGRPPRYAYFIGGSTGGRQALTEAQRYPNDYDGILAINPAFARERYVPAQLWPQILMREANNFLSKEKREAVTAAAIKACDGVDGAIDGVIDDPLRCDYDPKALVGTKIADSTFTETDARIIRGIWEGPRAHDGGFLWWGLTPGSDLSVLANTDGSPLAGKPCGEGLDWFRYFLMLDPQWDWTTLTRDEFELRFAQSIQVHASVYGGDNPDLTGLRDRGGKLLIVTGLADQIVPPQASIAYYEQVQKRMGGPERTAEFSRLFLVPGADHGLAGAGPSPTYSELKQALMQWVEEGRAPEQLKAELRDDQNKVIRTRVLHPHGYAMRSRSQQDDACSRATAGKAGSVRAT